MALKRPLVVPEGKTDPIYLRAAIKKLMNHQPQLGQLVDGEFSTKVRFMNFTSTVHEALHLGKGTGSFKRLIGTYRQKIKTFGHAPMEHPVILLLDNDDGAVDVFKTVKETAVRKSPCFLRRIFTIYSRTFIL